MEAALLVLIVLSGVGQQPSCEPFPYNFPFITCPASPSDTMLKQRRNVCADVQLAATFDWQQDTGTATGSPAKGTTRTTGVANANWKNSGVQGDVYSSYPIQAGNNSYQIVLFGKFTGTFNQILTGLFAHTAGSFGTGFTLKGIPNNTGDGDRYLYVTPSTTADTNLTVDMTTAIAIGSGVTVCFGATGPEATGKATSSTNATTYSAYLATQLQTTSSAAPGDTSSITLTFSYNEN